MKTDFSCQAECTFFLELFVNSIQHLFYYISSDYTTYSLSLNIYTIFIYLSIFLPATCKRCSILCVTFMYIICIFPLFTLQTYCLFCTKSHFFPLTRNAEFKPFSVNSAFRIITYFCALLLLNNTLSRHGICNL